MQYFENFEYTFTYFALKKCLQWYNQWIFSLFWKWQFIYCNSRHIKWYQTIGSCWQDIYKTFKTSSKQTLVPPFMNNFNFTVLDNWNIFIISINLVILWYIILYFRVIFIGFILFFFIEKKSFCHTFCTIFLNLFCFEKYR